MKVLFVLFASILSFQGLVGAPTTNYLLTLFNLQQTLSQALMLQFYQSAINNDQIALATPQVINTLLQSSSSSPNNALSNTLISEMQADLSKLGISLPTTAAPSATNAATGSGATAAPVASKSTSAASAGSSGTTAAPSATTVQGGTTAASSADKGSTTVASTAKGSTAAGSAGSTTVASADKSSSTTVKP